MNVKEYQIVHLTIKKSTGNTAMKHSLEEQLKNIGGKNEPVAWSHGEAFANIDGDIKPQFLRIIFQDRMPWNVTVTPL